MDKFAQLMGQRMPRTVTWMPIAPGIIKRAAKAGFGEPFASWKKLGCVVLRYNEQREALLAAQGDRLLMAFEQAKACFYAVEDENGQRVLSDVERAKFWNEMPPQYREKVMDCYAQLHVITDEDVGDFDEGCEVGTL